MVWRDGERYGESGWKAKELMMGGFLGRCLVPESDKPEYDVSWQSIALIVPDSREHVDRRRDKR